MTIVVDTTKAVGAQANTFFRVMLAILLRQRAA